MLARGFRTAAGDTTLRVRASALRNAGSLDVKKPTRLMKSGKTQRRPRLVRSQVAKNHLAAFTTKHSRRIGNDSNVKQQRIGFFSVATEIAFERPLTKKKKNLRRRNVNWQQCAIRNGQCICQKAQRPANPHAAAQPELRLAFSDRE